jgi:hypothetical protein
LKQQAFDHVVVLLVLRDEREAIFKGGRGDQCIERAQPM